MREFIINQPAYRCVVLGNGVIRGLYLTSTPTDNLIPAGDGCGCEVGNWIEFFSQLKHLDKDCLTTHTPNTCLEFEFIIAWDDAKILVRENLSFTYNAISQHFTFTIISGVTMLGDLVNRWTIRGDLFPRCTIRQQVLQHRSRNIYHQGVLSNVRLIGRNQFIDIANNMIKIPSPLQPVFDSTVYVRDEPIKSGSQPTWVIHLRAIVNRDFATRYIARWFYPMRLLPLWLSDGLGRIPAIKSLIWRARERFPKSPLNFGGTIPVSTGSHFILTSTLYLPAQPLNKS